MIHDKVGGGTSILYGVPDVRPRRNELPIDVCQSKGRGGFCRRNEEARPPRGKIATRGKTGERGSRVVLQLHEHSTLDRSCASSEDHVVP